MDLRSNSINARSVIGRLCSRKVGGKRRDEKQICSKELL